MNIGLKKIEVYFSLNLNVQTQVIQACHSSLWETQALVLVSLPCRPPIPSHLMVQCSCCCSSHHIYQQKEGRKRRKAGYLPLRILLGIAPAVSTSVGQNLAYAQLQEG